MAASDKLNKLVKYVEDMKGKLTSPPPAKRAKSPDAYYAWVRGEIALHSRKIDDLRMNEPAKK